MMRKILVMLLLFLFVFGISTTDIYGESYEKRRELEQKDTIKPYKRGGIRSPRRSYDPGISPPGRTAPTRPDNAARNPTPPRTTPVPRTGFGGFFGGIFGGLALGTILGSLFNPFAGFSLGFPFLSLLSFALWFIAIFAVVRMFRRRKGY